MFRAALIAAASLIAISALPASADAPSNDQLKAAALKIKLASSPSGSTKAVANRTGALIYNVTINRKVGAPTGSFYCTGYVFHYGACQLTNPSDGSCADYVEYEVQREVLATQVSASQYSCSVRLNYNFPRGDSSDYIYPWVEVYQRSSTSTTSYPSGNGYANRTLPPVLLPSTATTTFTVSFDQ